MHLAELNVEKSFTDLASDIIPSLVTNECHVLKIQVAHSSAKGFGNKIPKVKLNSMLKNFFLILTITPEGGREKLQK